MRALIIDDEPKARQNIANLISLLNIDIQIIGEAYNVSSAYEQIRNKKPDLIFLDIQMPDGSGFDLLKKFSMIDFKIIFITAYDQYAIKAFRHNAVDYLLKPINPEDFRDAINKLQQNSDKLQDMNKIMELIQQLKPVAGQKILLKTSEGVHLINTDEIIRCESDKGYTVFYLNDNRKILVSNVLKHYEESFSENKFLRPHQSHIVNIEYIASYIRSDGGYLVMKDGSTVPVSKRKREEILQKLESLG